MWDLKTGRLWRFQPPGFLQPTLLALSDDGLLAMGTEALPAESGPDPSQSKNTIQIWNLNTGRAVGASITVPGSVDALAFSARRLGSWAPT